MGNDSYIRGFHVCLAKSSRGKTSIGYLFTDQFLTKEKSHAVAISTLQESLRLFKIFQLHNRLQEY